MGCINSQPTQDNNGNENEVIIPKENTENGLKTVTTRVNPERIEPANGLQEDANLDSFSPRDIQLVGSNNNKPAVSNSKLLSKGRNSSQRNGTENAWGASNGRNVIDSTGATRKLRNELTDFEDEYGRDGVDLISSDVSYTQDDEKLIGSLNSRSSPDGSQWDTSSGRQMSKPPYLRKQDTDEVFDPSALIDIAKFKAANAPVAMTQESKENPENQRESTKETNRTRGRSEENNSHHVTASVVSPSNYNEFYDDDEKELLESIEHDYVTSPHVALPGAAM